MDSVAFLQQELWELDRQIMQLNEKREKLVADINQALVARALQKYNLPNSDVQV